MTGDDLAKDAVGISFGSHFEESTGGGEGENDGQRLGCECCEKELESVYVAWDGRRKQAASDEDGKMLQERSKQAGKERDRETQVLVEDFPGLNVVQADVRKREWRTHDIDFYAQDVRIAIWKEWRYIT